MQRTLGVVHEQDNSSHFTNNTAVGRQTPTHRAGLDSTPTKRPIDETLSITQMSSFPPNVDTGPLTSHPTQPKRWPILPSVPPTKASLNSDKTPADAPPIPARSRPRHMQPGKLSAPLPGLPPKRGLISKNRSNNPPTPRTSRATLLAGLLPFTNYNQPKSDASLGFENVQAFDEKDSHPPNGFILPRSHSTYSHQQNHGVMSPQSMYPPQDWQFPPVPMADDPAAREVFVETGEELEALHQRLERDFAKLSVGSQRARQQQGYTGGEYHQVQVQQVPQVYQNVSSQQQQQQQQLSQLHQSVFTQQEREWQFPQIQQAVPPQQQQQRQQQHSQAQQVVVPQQQHRQFSQVQQNKSHRQQFPQVQQSVFPRKQQQQQQLSESQKEDFVRQLLEQRQQQQQHPIRQPQQIVEHQQQPQHSFSAQQGVSPQQQQQQPPRPPGEVQPGLYIVYDPATQGYNYACEPLQNSAGGANLVSDVTKRLKDPSKSSEAVRQSTIPVLKSASPARAVELENKWGDQGQATTVNKPQGPQDSSSGMFSPPQDTFFSRFGGDNSITTPEAAAKDTLEALLRQSHEPNTSSSETMDAVNALGADSSTINAGHDFEFHTIHERDLEASEPKELKSLDTTAPLPDTQNAATIFAEAREDLSRLQADIEELSDGSDSSTETGGSDSEVKILSGQNSDHTTNNVCEKPIASESGPQDLRKSSEETASSSGISPSHKRSQLDDNNEDRARTDIGVSRKRTKLSSLRFICCFHNGPGRKCSGTDDTISEVLKKLSEQHDTHVCDRCWILKIKDESSGLYVHPDGGQTCDDHCLSPQCHKTTPTVGHRHLFDQTTCGTKTSRVRPGDREAAYRFVFRLVHPELECPSSVLTPEDSVHLDAVPRQSRRKLNREELTARANDLEKRLEAGEQENQFNTRRITQLQQELAAAHLATRAAEEKNFALEKQTRRIIAMLSDALRTGLFMDFPEHQSLLRRVEEDAPGALVHQSQPQSLLTPPASDGSRNSSATPVRVDVAGQGQDQPSRPAGYEGSASARTAPLGTVPRDRTTDEYMSGAWNVEPAWLDMLDEPGESEVINLQGDRW